MNLKEEILKEHSKAQCNRIADYIGTDTQRFADLITLFLNDDYRITQRSAWIISTCTLRYPFLIKPHLKKMILKLNEPNIHDAVKRNVIRILEDIELPNDLIDDIVNVCFKFLISTSEGYAVKAFSMTVLGRVAKKIPELKSEIQYAIEDQMMRYQEVSPAIIHRGKKVLFELKKMK